MPRHLFANPLRPASESPWLDVAERVADQLRETILDREASNEIPHDVVDLLREHGLLSVIVRTDLGGAGEPWSTGAEIARILARVDAGIAHAVGYHYTWLWFTQLYDTDTGREIVRRSAERQSFWASIGSAFGGSGGIRADGEGYLIDAKRGFATGAPLADLFFTQTVSADDGRFYISAVDTTLDGVSVFDDWDAVGQRLSASTGVVLDAVRVSAADVIAVLPPPGQQPAPLQSLMIPSFQLLFAYLNLGITEGALFEARAYVLESGRPWIHSGVDSSTDDPYIQSLFGEHASKALGVEAQVHAAGDVLGAFFAGTLEITPTTRGQAAELIAAAKVVSHRVALDASTAIFDATGARSSARRFGLDRFWRNARTITLHDPVSYKYKELGDYVLTGALPEPSVYR
ncbi:acyl-CoA dehydrogenase family protein [Subtercola sp. YIM 133946]|uniref:acyl-CoA dehydrogenase family protein n=1 Tax=Subtercola sp. YIM 133946 TaxID=3118909 RepID=UPI002F95FA3E